MFFEDREVRFASPHNPRTWREHRSPEPRPPAVEEVLRQVDLLAIYRSRYQAALSIGNACSDELVWPNPAVCGD
jgi:hypothetical protein